MKTNIITPKSLFKRDICYTIPEFQRPYVWKQDEQWEPLWDDVRNTAEEYIEKLKNSDGSRVEAERKTQPHFLGAVVLQHVHTASIEIEQRKIIDGQQRITTLQLLLDAVQYVCEELELKPEAKRLAKLVTNDTDLVMNEENQLFKLWPSRLDREAFRHAMHNGLATSTFEGSLIVQAHEFFQTQARQWLRSESSAMQQRMEALETTLTGKLQMVVIDIGHDENPHIIFETLNARGTPLLESDLIKNYAISRGVEENASELWGELEDEWWREEIGRGRLRRPRIDVLLNYWLSMSTTDEVPLGSTFSKFKTYVDPLPIVQVMTDVRRDLVQYRSFETESRSPEESLFHDRCRVMQAGAITPALLILLSIPDQKRIKAFKALESFLVRRMICRATTKDYNRLTLDLVNELQNQGSESADVIVPDFLKRQTATSREWPSDDALGRSMDDLPLFRMLTRGRLRLILEGIERKYRTPMAEQQDVPSRLTIEHVMPVSWETYWPLPDGIDWEDGANRRNHLVHTFGNLTLVNGHLNSSLSNAPWVNKRATLERHSVLLLNRVLLDESRDVTWDEQFIQNRSRRMAALVADIWPGPQSSIWTS